MERVEAVITAHDIDGQRLGLAEVLDVAWEAMEHGVVLAIEWPECDL